MKDKAGNEVKVVTLHISLDEGDTTLCKKDIYHPFPGEAMFEHLWVTEYEFDNEAESGYRKCDICKHLYDLLCK